MLRNIENEKEEILCENLLFFHLSRKIELFLLTVTVTAHELINTTCSIYEQYIIDPDREYGELCKNLNGTLIKIGPGSDTFINIFDIREDSLEEDVYKRQIFTGCLFEIKNNRLNVVAVDGFRLAWQTKA